MTRTIHIIIRATIVALHLYLAISQAYRDNWTECGYNINLALVWTFFFVMEHAYRQRLERMENIIYALHLAGNLFSTIARGLIEENIGDRPDKEAIATEMLQAKIDEECERLKAEQAESEQSENKQAE